MTIKEAKQRVQQDIDRQRLIIGQYDRNETAPETDDARWYERESTKLARLKDELYQLRLRGGEFHVRTQSNTPMVLEVSPSGRMTLYELSAADGPARRGSVAQQAASATNPTGPGALAAVSSADASAGGGGGGGGGGSLHAMSMPVSIIHAPTTVTSSLTVIGEPSRREQLAASTSRMSFYASAKTNEPALSLAAAVATGSGASNAENTDAANNRLLSYAYRKPAQVMYVNSLLKVRPVESMSMFGSLQLGSSDKLVRLDFKAGSMSLAVADADELLQVLGSHLLRYNHHKVNQIRRLIELHELKSTPFSRFCPHHEILLHRLWSVLLPNEPPEPRVSERWKLLGFQSKDPTSDLRGMGMMGLHTLLYFAETYTSACQEIVHGNRNYPFAAVGVNVTQMCCALVNMADDVVRLPPSDLKWDTPALTFFSHVENENAFEELFCFAFELLDLVFVRTQAEYMDFPSVYDRVQQLLKEMLEKHHPLSFEELRALVDWSSSHQT